MTLEYRTNGTYARTSINDYWVAYSWRDGSRDDATWDHGYFRRAL